MSIFERYAPFIQDYIYRNNWESLRAIQTAAADAIFNTDENVLLSASTASGKTEAAFFPILTLFTEDMPRTVGAIYIGPLKALINDQFMRLNELCDEADIPVWHWHGDVAQSHKNKMLKKPSGILQITPESLEAMLMRKHAMIPKLFGDLRFIVIDEIHSLMRGDRGGQTICLIERLCRMAGANPRRIGLSATIGDPEAAGRFLAYGSGRGTVIPKIEAKGVKWRLSMEHFYISQQNIPEGKETPDALPVLDEKTDTAPENADSGMGYIFEHTRGKKCLIFVNSREECEAVTTTLRSYCEAKHEPDRFLIHHGNLSAAYRETAEQAMKDEDTFMTTCTTATLELGIDIGRLERAFQIDAPFTVSSFLQRMGRTGRRELPPEMWFVIREELPEPRSMLPETIPWKLLQGIALIQVYLEEKWVEPPKLDRLPYSLLYHQTMSTLASCGELTPAALASKVLSLSYFNRISKDDYKILLRHLLENDHIQRTEEGGLIIGITGERVVNSFKFYAVFQENEEYTVRWGSQELGTIVSPPPVGEKVAIAGHVWIVEEVDHKRRLVYCEQIKGKVPAYFGDCPGDINTKILERMKQVLIEDKRYPYLMKNAVLRLDQARLTARNSGVTERPLICLGGNMWCLLPWLGTYAFLAMERFLKLKCADRLGLRGMDSARPYYIQFTMKVSSEEFFSIVTEEAQKEFDPLELVYNGEVPVFEKYDEFLPEILVKKGFAHGILGIKEMKSRIKDWEYLIN
ncbi:MULTISPECIES: DEAD/DEAH box helicase [Ruminococcus]|uniref:ATP-dependent helicase Lhr and Lhr-like helicase n=1 Tax=Ruminococcus flavefaciens TaxID=1265 RepID=A0A1M7HCT0_RUMFL|nr:MULTISPECIES: DEAD/DEAH box helicase [Ruminococcus]MCR4795381.1 DEAD/DEAH box helicase [Ruminococcus sp.]SHM26260.1 ATP-dependent helicase Lhr and Lhr-like helicase [Ruminococcus flavefaciens]